MPGSFQRPDMPQESAISPAEQGLTHDGRLQAIPAHPRGVDGQTLPTSRWVAATQSYVRTQPGAENQAGSPFDTLIFPRSRFLTTRSLGLHVAFCLRRGVFGYVAFFHSVGAFAPRRLF